MKTLTTQLAEIKNVHPVEIKDIETAEGVNIFKVGKSYFEFNLTPKGKVVAGSVKYLYPIENYNNCSC
jgi:hypothetical protein